jgi:Predicted NADH:ubiquinone oxidoreductase, subunit RnfE
MKTFIKGLIKENPLFTLYLGICSALAISTTLDNALGLGLTVVVVLTLTKFVISLLGKMISEEIIIPVSMIVGATLVKCMDLLLQAYTPSLSSSLGVFLPLIVVSGMFLVDTNEKQGIAGSIMDGLGKGLGYTLGLVIVSVIRQFLATGTLLLTNPFTNTTIFNIGLSEGFVSKYGIAFFREPAGAFLVCGLVAALFVAINHNKGKENK